MGYFPWATFHDHYVEGWNDHDPAKVLAQFAEGGTYVDPRFDEPITGEKIGEIVRESVELFPDLRFERRRVMDDETAHVRVEEWTMHGTHEGMSGGLPPTGNSIALEGASVVQLSSDGIVSIQGYYDRKQFLDQLGLTLPDVIGQLPTLAAGAMREQV